MNPLLRWAIRLTYHPSRWFHAAMCGLGLWRHWVEIDEFVILGAVPTSADVHRLAELGVTGIVNLCSEFAGHPTAMEATGIAHLHLPTVDYHCPAEADLLRGVEFIRSHAERGGRVYVHCKAGRKRGALMAIAYLVGFRGLSPSEAYHLVRSRRPQVNRGLDRVPAIRSIDRRFNGGAAGTHDSVT